MRTSGSIPLRKFCEPYVTCRSENGLSIKRSTGFLAVTIGVVIGTAAACTVGSTPSPNNIPARHKVVYHVSGEGQADITYTLESQIAETNGTTLPWTFKTEKSTTIGHIIAAMLRGGDSAAIISCTVIVDDKVTVTNTGTHQVSCASER